MESPEAIATILVLALSFFLSTLLALFNLFAKFPIIVRLLENRSLIYVDDAHEDKVSVVFKHKLGESHIKQLRQLDFEVYNSHPKRKVEEISITVILPNSNTTILVAAVANGDNRTPELGGRKIVTSIVDVPSKPVDLLDSAHLPETNPAIVVSIPYLESSLSNDRFYLRVTYDGPYLYPVVQGAMLTSVRMYRLQQRLSLLNLGAVLAAVALALTFVGNLQVDPLFFLTYWNNYYLRLSGILLTILVLVLLVSVSKEDWFYSWWRTPSQFLSPLPTKPESLGKLHFYDSSGFLPKPWQQK
jgi:hypothetical protein